MRDYGNHEHPVVSALPSSGIAGQVVYYSGEHFYWNTTLGAWLPFDGYYDSVLSATVTLTTTLTTVLSFPCVANAMYDFYFQVLWQSTAANVIARTAITVSSGTFNSNVMASGSGSGTATPAFLQLNTSGTSQAGPGAAAANTNALITGTGLFTCGTTAGTLAVQMDNAGTGGLLTSTASGTITVGKGSYIRARRIG